MTKLVVKNTGLMKIDFREFGGLLHIVSKVSETYCNEDQ